MTPIGENKSPHQLETFDFVAMYPNIPVPCLKRVMKEFLELVFTYEQVTYGNKSIYVKFGHKNDEVTPEVNEVHWFEHPPVEVCEDPEIKREFYVGRYTLCEWINFVLNEGFVQLGINIYINNRPGYLWELLLHRI